MNKQQIKKLVSFLYSADTTSKVPFRLALTMGQYMGCDLDEMECERLLNFLADETNYNTESFKKFLKQ
jgi:hypothetical protein